MNNELYHHGIKGQRWGVRRTPEQLGYDKKDSSVTKRVKKDYNTMSDKEFMKKYQTTKKAYAKRVAKYGDPYMNSPLAKMGKKLKDKNQNDTKQTKEITSKEKYEEQVKRNRNIAKVGAGAEIAGIVMKSIGQRMYNDNKLNSTVGKTAVINILGYGGDISEKVGKYMIVGSGVSNLMAYDKYRKDSIKKIYKK